MGKLKQVSTEELAAAMEAAEDMHIRLDDIADRVEKGYMGTDNTAAYDESISTLLWLGRDALRLANALHMKARMVRDADDLRVLMEKRLRKQAQ